MKVDLTDTEIRLITQALGANRSASAQTLLGKLHPVTCPTPHCDQPMRGPGHCATHLVLSHHKTPAEAERLAAGAYPRRLASVV